MATSIAGSSRTSPSRVNRYCRGENTRNSAMTATAYRVEPLGQGISLARRFTKASKPVASTAAT
jgi:hypothetical protein